MVQATPVPINGDSTSRRYRLEVREMECDEENPRNNPRIDKEKHVIDLDQDFNIEFDSLKKMIEEEPATKIPVGGEVVNQVVVA